MGFLEHPLATGCLLRSEHTEADSRFIRSIRPNRARLARLRRRGGRYGGRRPRDPRPSASGKGQAVRAIKGAGGTIVLIPYLFGRSMSSVNPVFHKTVRDSWGLV